MNTEPCHLCQSTNITLFKDFSLLPQVTSDCKPWHSGGKLILCNNCHTLQKLVNQSFQDNIKKIYQSYQIYYQSEGAEQRGFDQQTGTSFARSQLICQWLYEQNILTRDRLPEPQKMLDIGCGPGKFLDAFSKVYPKWEVAGFEIDDKHRENIEKEYKKNSFYSGSLDTLDKHFNLIALIHTLEHISSPSEVLTKIRNTLSPNGHLLIAVPDFTKNPFDLLIADHCTHFNQQSLTTLLYQNGFSIIAQLNKKLTKEIILIAKKISVHNTIKKETDKLTRLVSQQIDWLSSTREQAINLGKKKKFAVFGTAIAANWLLGFNQESIQFFLDEDPQRINLLLQNIPVYHPKSLKFDHKIPVILPFPMPLAKKIALRLEPYKISCLLPEDTPL